MSFRDGGGAAHVLTSNSVSLTRAQGLPATVRFTRIPASFTGKLPLATCQSARNPLLTLDVDGDGQAEAPAYNDTRSYTGSSPVIIELTNPSGNLDPTKIETSKVVVWSKRGDVEHLTLSETGPNTGIFTGAIASAVADVATEDCTLQTLLRSAITVEFDGGPDGTNSASDTALIDPYGFVFNSLTGEPVNGVKVTLINDATGLPAQVFGDDGVSAYPSTVTSGDTVSDSGGTVYPGGLGQYRFPQLAKGKYHLQFQTPAQYVAPSAATPAQLASLLNPLGTSFIIDGSSYGQSFSLVLPDALQIDVPVDPGNAALSLDKIASVRTASPGDAIQYRLRLVNRDGAVTSRGVTITDMLPLGLRYRTGSTRGAAEPEVAADGRGLTFHPGMMKPGASLEIRYSVTVAPGAPLGEAMNRAVAINPDGKQSAEGRATVRIQPLLNVDALTIVGRVTEGECGLTGNDRKGVAGVRLLLEDGTYVVTDREGLYHIEGVRKGRHVVQIDQQSLKPGYSPIACNADTRTAGRAWSRFVEGQGGTMQRVDFTLRHDLTAENAAQQKAIGSVLDDATAAGNGIDWLEGQTAPGVDWLFPATDYNPRAPVLRVVIKHVPGQTIELLLNGAPVDVLARDQSDGNAIIAIAKWTGLPLREGDNEIEARVSDATGKLVTTLNRTVHYANVAAHGEYLPARSVLTADGLTRPLIAVRLTDREGKPVRAGTPVAFTIDQPYTAAIEAEMQDRKPLEGLGRALPAGRVVGDDGVALIALQPTTQAGAARMVLTFIDKNEKRSEEIRPWLQAVARDWVVVGFGAGTVGHDILSGKAKPAQGLVKSDTFTDGQLAFYAKGRIKGSWLLTMAYDSNRKANPDRGLLSTIDPDRYYTVYGDATQQGYDASTRGKLYLRLERRQFYALFGDFQTNLTQTQLTRFSRTLNGLKGEFHGRTVTFNGFAANSSDVYGRDEIQGNGLSGPYRLRGRAIVPNSDKIRLETRDRFRSELIVDSRQLTRHIDYDIDVDAGTLIFKSPVLSRDVSGNPIFIVAEYELYGTGAKRLVAGGRAAISLLDNRVEVGVTALRDETSGKAGVGGVDLKARITKTTEVRLEAAAGGQGSRSTDRAYIAELEHHDSRTDLTAYLRQQDQGYGLAQQNAVEAGTRKIGADGRVRITKRISLNAAAWHQESLTGPASRNALDAQAEWHNNDGTTLHAGIKIADDRTISNGARSSRLLVMGGSKELLDHKLLVQAENQFALGGQQSSIDFPVRRTIGASYAFTDSIRLIGGYELAEGAAYTAHSIRAGLDLSPWAGAKMVGTMNQEAVGESGPRSFAQFGLSQAMPIGPHWTVDGSVDSSQTVKGRALTTDVVNPLQPVSSGGSLAQDIGNPNEDFTSIALGAAWQAGNWSWNGRAEYRNGTSSNRIGVSSNLMRRLGEGKTIASSLRAYTLKNSDGSIADLVSADIAIAWRPLGSRWSTLERIELRHQRGDAGIATGNVLGVNTANGVNTQTTRIINNLAVNWRDGLEGEQIKWDVSLYYGVKYVRGKFDDDHYDGLIDVTGFDLRRSIGAKLDIGFGASVQHAWTDKTIAYSFGPSVGVSPATNMWISLGYNVQGFGDRDFSDNRYLKQGPYLTLRLKFDQESAAALAGKLRKTVR